MYPSTEIRWFFDKENSRIIDWFARKEISFQSIQKRTDHYLRYGQEDIGIKLREGKVEIKKRTAGPEVLEAGSHATGYRESWTKWSFGIDRQDPWADKIINLQIGKQEWTAVDKWRLGVKRTFDDLGHLVFKPINELVSSACQIEFTRLLINGKTYFTFGIEWYGETFVPLEASTLDEILGDSVFSIDRSMGYAAFLMTV